MTRWQHHVVWDCETYPNWYFVYMLHVETMQPFTFEVSDRVDQLPELVHFCDRMRASKDLRMVGFNSIGFDYPILHDVMTSRGAGITALNRWERASQIIGALRQWGVRPWEVLIPQLDLFKVHHFDNRAKSTGLKALQFAMRSPSVEDLPFAPGTYLTPSQMDEGVRYCEHDVVETYRFFEKSRPLVEFRDALSERYGYDATNFNDTKIGKDYFIKRLEQVMPGSCYDPITREPRQTLRGSVPLSEVVLPWIRFEHPELQRVHRYLLSSSVPADNVKGFFSKKRTGDDGETPLVVARLDGFEMAFGAGGVHGSVRSRSFVADAEHAILDVDVSGYYPSLAIACGFYPRHLGRLFLDVGHEVVAERRTHKKGTPENQMLKLAGNGGMFGDSGNEFSPFYDVGYLLSVTMNGQLLLCMLVEQLARLGELIQVNTDGATLLVHRDRLDDCRALMRWWEGMTKLQLEEKFYKRMHVRDVNAYLAVSKDGKVKRKGPYSHVVGYNLGDGELAWHQDHGALVVPKAAEECLLRGVSVEQTVVGCRDPFDFMMLAKAARGAKLVLDGGEELSKSVRYFVSTDGRPLVKVMPPPPGCVAGQYKRANGVDDVTYHEVLEQVGPDVWDERIHTKNKSRYEERRIGVNASRLAGVCNRAERFRFEAVDYGWYIDEARALVAAAGGTL